MFTILSKGRTTFPLSALEAIFIKAKSPILCRQKNMSTVSSFFINCSVYDLPLFAFFLLFSWLVIMYKVVFSLCLSLYNKYNVIYPLSVSLLCCIIFTFYFSRCRHFKFFPCVYCSNFVLKYLVVRLLTVVNI